MIEFVSKPNLPRSAAGVLLGEKYLNLLEEPLITLGVTVYPIPDNPFVDERLSGHADLSVLHAGDRLIFAANHLLDSTFSEQMHSLGYELRYIEEAQSREYPNDCQLNLCSAGDYLVYSKAVSSDKVVNHFLQQQGSKPIDIKQGYVKCSICIVDENSVITADAIAAKKLKENGMNVLQISAGNIDLAGFPYGFIGGSTFKLSEKQLVFTGKLDRHPDKESILSFIESRGISAVYLTDRDIFDVGSILPIYEK